MVLNCALSSTVTFDRSEMSSHSDGHFTGAELSKLNQLHNIHVAYAGKIYDTSGFLPHLLSYRKPWGISYTQNHIIAIHVALCVY